MVGADGRHSGRCSSSWRGLTVPFTSTRRLKRSVSFAGGHTSKEWEQFDVADATEFHSLLEAYAQQQPAPDTQPANTAPVGVAPIGVVPVGQPSTMISPVGVAPVGVVAPVGQPAPIAPVGQPSTPMIPVGFAPVGQPVNVMPPAVEVSNTDQASSYLAAQTVDNQPDSRRNRGDQQRPTHDEQSDVGLNRPQSI